MDLLNFDEPVRVIESEEDYELALSRMASLVERGTPDGSDAQRLLRTLGVLIKDYETREVRIATPGPLEAIRFRMEQQGLAPKDLIPFLGSRSRVSEVLSGKRPLSLAMVRSLHRGLGIPASSLLSQQQDAIPEAELDWTRIPFAKMKKRKWIDRLPKSASDAAALFHGWLGDLRTAELSPHFRRKIRTSSEVDHEALFVWTAQVAKRALAHPPHNTFEGVWSDTFFRDVAKLSAFSNGPKLLEEFLARHGIALVVEPALSPWLDGAALKVRHVAVIALTVRHNRLDNFWFVVMHELVHLFKHLDGATASVFDDLDSVAPNDPQEVEADQIAGDLLIPLDAWRSSPASHLRTPEAVSHLARNLSVHPAIVAGRIRKEYRDYRVLSGLVGNGEVRKLFPVFQESGDV